MLLKVNGADGTPGIGLEPGLADELYKQVRAVSEQQEASGEPCVLVVNPQLRPLMQRLLRSAVKGVKILSFNEIPDDWDIKIVAAVGG
jgi:flagellar biosynthesis protein FlhA